MTEPPIELGHGVRVAPDREDRLTVISTAGLTLPWRPRSGPFVGSAVQWSDRLFEVCDGTENADGGIRWRLEPWPDGEAIRHLDRLDAERIEALAGEWRETGAGRRIRTILVWLAPLTGLMPRHRQEQWERRYNVPGGRITAISAAVEMLVGACGIVLPMPIVLRLAGWMLFVEGLIRFWIGMTQDEPLGSFLTLPLAVEPAKPARPSTPMSSMEVIRWAPDGEVLELAFFESRTDWYVDGVLRFRGGTYQLVERIPGGGRLVYAFDRVSDDVPVTLSLAPPPAAVRQRTRGRGILRDVGRLFLLSLAPGRVQAAMTPEYNVPPRTLTWVCGVIELIGGGMNLLVRGGDGQTALIDLIIVGEGLVRLVAAAVSGAPVGSILGLPFAPLYGRWLDEGRPEQRG